MVNEELHQEGQRGAQNATREGQEVKEEGKTVKRGRFQRESEPGSADDALSEAVTAMGCFNGATVG